MGVDLSLSEQLAFITTRIQCEKTDGTISVGTGLFFQYTFAGDKTIPVIVTNRHVIEGSKRGVFHLTRTSENGEPVPGDFEAIVVDNFEQSWIPHPDPMVDLCIMPMEPLPDFAERQSVKFFYRSLDESLIPTSQVLSELTALEEVLTIGYPIGLWDAVNNMPIFRKGITATHPNLNYEGRDEFLIDAACFPGCSGSPVLIYNLGAYPTRRGDIILGTRILFLGILYAVLLHVPAEGKIEFMPVPTRIRTFGAQEVPINLGVVIKARRLLDFKPVLRKIALDC